MSKRINLHFLLFLGLSFLAVSLHAQDTERSVLSDEILQAHDAGVTFTSVELFSAVQGEKHEVLKDETLLSPNASYIRALYEKKPDAITLEMKTSAGKAYKLELLQSNPYAQNPDVGYIDNNGRHPLQYDRSLHYQGAITGSNKSLATMSISAAGDVMMLFANEDGNFVVGKLEDNSNHYILYNDKDFKVTPLTSCATADNNTTTDYEPASEHKGTAAYNCYKVGVYFETDYEIYYYKQSSTVFLQSYISGLFNQIQTLYRNERIAIELRSLYMWTVDDGYTKTSSNAALTQFSNSWNAKGNNFDGDVAVLVAKDASGNGGIAWLDVLCGQGQPHAYGDINGSYQTVPTYSWDVVMLTHELGHSLSSRHTHWCGWKTGPGGTCGSIDNCYNQESGNSCGSTCGSLYNNAQPANAWQGTIMSYCHLVSRGVDVANGFGPLPGDQIRSRVNSVGCLKSIISATLTPTPICKESGGVVITLDSTVIGSRHFGANPMVYVWSNGDKTQNITVKTAGTYTVKITDSNGCVNNYAVEVKENTNDSCKIIKASVSVIDQQYVSVYPNPAHGNAMLKFFSNKATTTAVRITDIAGRTVGSFTKETVNGENNVVLDLTGLQSGMYYITLSSPDMQYTNLKIVVE